MVALRHDHQDGYTLICGDALTELKKLPTHSIDAICTDPPAGIGFMLSKERQWDSDKGGRTQWVAWLAEIMQEALRVIKPGGHALVWALPRTSHWTATALEDAGFEIRDVVTHLFGSGFPKSLDISKALDRMAGAEREVIGKSQWYGRNPHGRKNSPNENRDYGVDKRTDEECNVITIPATAEAQQWQGWGTALKPASEHWILARAPLSEKTIAEQVLATGTGGLNIDACRVTLTGIENHRTAGSGVIGTQHGIYGKAKEQLSSKQVARAEQGLNPRYEPQGRFPSNTLLSHTLLCKPLGVKKVQGAGWKDKDNERPFEAMFEGGWEKRQGNHYTDSEGMEEIEAYECVEWCPVYQLDQQSGIRKSGGRTTHIGDMKRDVNVYQPDIIHIRQSEFHMQASEGGASRYFQRFHPTLDDYPPFVYASKASRRDRSSNGAVNNIHPTCKSTELMRYLVRLVTPPNGTVLDCFMGSGSTGVAAIQCGFSFIGIEQEEAYVDTARARIHYAMKEGC